ncbi:MAG: 4-(cytidine 5'-diphospho)-2-C-methyl-D-erythritol kinase [Spirochaetaceae bacterium]|jgi:4-diphosphocytidyl-2-C-methyl-D-erythritol kinase|nr:4-(cytidine 5'-diphospho)-2-C-methyl-D-erythritol kinase [Spirochaetaceae bacterium]
MKTARLTLAAPCKVNLHLRVKELRADGCHELESIFLALAFGDTLDVEVFDEPGPVVLSREYRIGRGAEGPGGGPGRIGGGAELPPPEKDLAYRAAALFRETTGFEKALALRLVKRVPLGAGLGGGSSDAAAVLRGLDALAGTALSRKALASMAGALGSDVPFFLEPGAAFVSGRGELIRPLPVPEKLRVVLVNPGFPSDTAGAFRRLDRDREERDRRGQAEAAAGGAAADPEALIAALGRDPGSWPYGNDFLPLFLKEGGEAYRRIIGDLKALGADFAGLSGSGSTCFGIFTGGGSAERAARNLAERWNFIVLTFPLASSGMGVLQ